MKNLFLTKALASIFLLFFTTAVYQQAFSQFGDWVFINGELSSSKPFSIRPVYVTGGSPNVVNNPGTRYGSAYWSVGNSFFIFGGSSGNGYYNDLWQLDSVTLTWKWLDGDSIVNQPRVSDDSNGNNNPASSFESGFCSSDSSLYLFGGYGLPVGYQNDLWQYNVSNKQWVLVKRGAAAKYGTKGVGTSETMPRRRSGATLWYKDGNIYMFGGKTTNFVALSDLWQFNLESKIWTWIDGDTTQNSSGYYQTGVNGVLVIDSSNIKPASRDRSIGFVYESKLYLFGGLNYSFSNPQYFSHLEAFDLKTGKWNLITRAAPFLYPLYGNKGIFGSSTFPDGRVGSSGYFDDSLFYVFGGETSRTKSAQEPYFKSINDLMVFDPRRSKWGWLSGDSLPGSRPQFSSSNGISLPGSRAYSAIGKIGTNLLMFGGVGPRDSGLNFLLNDLWTYPLNIRWVCPNSESITLTTNSRASADYQWQIDTSGVFTDLTTNNLWSGFNSPTLALIKPSQITSGSKFRCKISANGISSFSNETVLRISSIWTGEVSSNWDDPNNWNCRVVPDSCTEIFINQGVTNWPSIGVAAKARKISIDKGGSLNVPNHLLLKENTGNH